MTPESPTKIPADPCFFYGTAVSSRLLLGTARYPSPAVLSKCIEKSQSEIATVSLRREAISRDVKNQFQNRFWDHLKELDRLILPNTAGCFSAAEAIVTARMARDLFETSWIKLEVVKSALTLEPDHAGLVEAARVLAAEGFKVFPYTTTCIDLGKALVDAGCEVLMPWASPIGTGQGLSNSRDLETYRNSFAEFTLVVDAGIGRPSHATAAMEIGYDAVLVNTAIATAADPIKMSEAFGEAVRSGRNGFKSGLMTPRNIAVPSTPMEGLAFSAIP